MRFTFPLFPSGEDLAARVCAAGFAGVFAEA